MTFLIAIVYLISTLLVEKWMTLKSSAFIVFHRYDQSLILKRLGDSAKYYGSAIDSDPKKNRELKDYQLEHRTLKLEESKRMKHFFRIEDKRIMVLDHHSINTDFGFKPDILILMNSPKVNLERFLKVVHPEIIVADGSNFFNYKSLRQRTAEKHNIIFYDTAKMGAFVM